ncbi:hypothetical protein RHSIM_Rhsim04G0199900 [Rhododendron simsii]|uniref:Proteasome subunit beta type-4 n=1 Tax=Rhododendron simsii TaxID=118357 RepID=A0A834H1C4_RHOSS|nr:hypothetical protein RHSIM_Rhsim04G0199900 [Rhododendron simsii]
MASSFYTTLPFSEAFTPGGRRFCLFCLFLQLCHSVRHSLPAADASAFSAFSCNSATFLPSYATSSFGEAFTPGDRRFCLPMQLRRSVRHSLPTADASAFLCNFVTADSSTEHWGSLLVSHPDGPTFHHRLFQSEVEVHKLKMAQIRRAMKTQRSNLSSSLLVGGLPRKGFALVVADSSAVHSILVHKSNEDKIMILDSHKLMGASGEAGDRAQFTEYIQKNVALYQFRNGIPLTTAAAANFTRGELATALRKDLLSSSLEVHWVMPTAASVPQSPYMVNIILAGYDKETGPSLYFIDYIASMHKVDKAAFGYGSYFSLAMMDRHYHSNMTVEEAIDLVDKCIIEIRSRLVVAPPNFVIKIVDDKGAREYAWRESIKDAHISAA